MLAAYFNKKLYEQNTGDMQAGKSTFSKYTDLVLILKNAEN